MLILSLLSISILPEPDDCLQLEEHQRRTAENSFLEGAVETTYVRSVQMLALSLSHL